MCAEEVHKMVTTVYIHIKEKYKDPSMGGGTNAQWLCSHSRMLKKT